MKSPDRAELKTALQSLTFLTSEQVELWLETA
jgi:hypothetical protein